MRIDLSITADKKVQPKFAHSDLGAGMDLPEKDLQDFVDYLGTHTASRIGILPAAVRWMSSDRRIVVFERPPAIKRISWVPTQKEQVTAKVEKMHAKSVAIPIPWQVYIIYFNQEFVPVNVYMFFRNAMLASMQDTLYLAPMFNLYLDSMLCNPVFGEYEHQDASLNAGIQVAYNMVWNSGFNYDLVDTISEATIRRRPFEELVSDEETKEILQSKAYEYDDWTRFFATWATYTVSDVIDFEWPMPYTSKRNGERLTKTNSTLYNAIVRCRENVLDAGADDRNHKQEFMIGLVNFFSS